MEMEGGVSSVTAMLPTAMMRALAADAMRPDDLARALGLDVVSAARTLGRLEASGVIARYADGRYGIA